MSRKRLVLLAALCAVSVLLVSVTSSAQAAGTDDSFGSAACVVRGAAGTATGDGLGDNAGVNSVLYDLFGNDSGITEGGTTPNPSGILNGDTNAGGASEEGGPSSDPTDLLDTDGGDFTFQSQTVACVGVDLGGARIGATAGADFSINAGGDYTNLICGSGQAQGQAVLTRGANTSVTTNFGITFAGGNGALTISSAKGNVRLDQTNVAQGAGDSEDVDTGNGGGVVHIAPQANDASGSNCVTNNTRNFLVDAAFDTVLSGDTNANP